MLAIAIIMTVVGRGDEQARISSSEFCRESSLGQHWMGKMAKNLGLPCLLDIFPCDSVLAWFNHFRSWNYFATHK